MYASHFVTNAMATPKELSSNTSIKTVITCLQYSYITYVFGQVNSFKSHPAHCVCCQTLFNSLPVQHDDQTIIVCIPSSSRVAKYKSRSLAPQEWRRLKLSRRDLGLVSVAQKINLMMSPLLDMRLASLGCTRPNSREKKIVFDQVWNIHGIFL